MKYSIFGYEQKKLEDYEMDSIDLVILDYLLYKSLNTNLQFIIHNDNKYVWITNDLIVKDLPFLRLKVRGMQCRIDNLAQIGFIDRVQKYDVNRVKKSYMRITEQINILKFDDTCESILPPSPPKAKTKNNSNNNEDKFVKPTLEEVEAYCRERNNNINAEQFIAFYDSNGWKVGKNPMKSWKSAIITWEGRNKDRQKQSQSTFNKVYKKEDYEGCDF